MPDGCVEVIVKHADGETEVTVCVSGKSTIQEVKEAIANHIQRPEVLESGAFVTIQNDGQKKQIADGQKLGPRRSLIFEGCPLTPAPVEDPPRTVEDFDPRDEEMIIESPRTLKACEIECIDPEDLFYVPLKACRSAGVSKRIARLRHGFFEAVRQDTVEIVRKARRVIMVEEASRIPMSTTSTGPGGLWGGALKPELYPRTHYFLHDLEQFLTKEKAVERPKGSSPQEAGNRRSIARMTHWDVDSEKPPHIMAYLTSKGADLDTDAVEWACEDCVESVAKLKKLPAGTGEQVRGLPLRTENMVATQVPAVIKQLRREHRSKREIVGKQVAVAEGQMDKLDWHLDEVKERNQSRVKRFNDSLPAWRSRTQKENAEKTKKHEEQWQLRRADRHETQIEAEAERREALEKLNRRDAQVERRVANMRSLAKVHFARTWTDRRTSWGRNHLAVVGAAQAFGDDILRKQAESEARCKEQQDRIQCLIDFRREFKSLRRVLAAFEAEREQMRQNARRRAIADEFNRMASDMDARRTSASRSWFGASQLNNTASKYETAKRSTTNKFPRSDWGRFGAEKVSQSSYLAHSTMLPHRRRASLPALSLTI